MKYCTNCGNELSEEAVICPKCGCAVASHPLNQNTSTQQNGSLSPLSIVGFVLSFVASVAGLICSIIAFNNAKNSGDTRSKGFAKAGIIISACSIGISFITGIITGIFLAIYGVQFDRYYDIFYSIASIL